jgi:hypothetical protein
LGIAETVGQTLAAAIEKDMIQEIIARGLPDTHCVAEVVRLELRNPSAGYVFEMS